MVDSFVFILFFGCNRSPEPILSPTVTNLPLTNPASSILTFTPSTLPIFTPSPTLSDTPESTLTPTPFVKPTSIVQESCVQVVSNLDSQLSFKGTLVVHNEDKDKTYFLNLENGQKRTFATFSPQGRFSPQSWSWEYAFSPDGKWMAYGEIYLNETGSQIIEKQVHIIAADGRRNYFPYWPNEKVDIVGWLNNDQLALYRAWGPEGEIIVLTPLTGEFITFKPTVPSKLITLWSFLPQYNSTVDHVLYDVLGPGYEIWNLNSKQKVWEIQYEPNSFVPYPKWSPSGNEIAFVLPEGRTQNLYRTDLIGNEKQVTFLEDSYDPPYSAVDQFYWSPDGNLIAVWLKIRNKEQRNLALLDIRTQEIRNLCITDDGNGYDNFDNNFIVWNANSQQFAISGTYEFNDTVIVDIATNIAYLISENERPIGWMTNE